MRLRVSAIIVFLSLGAISALAADQTDAREDVLEDATTEDAGAAEETADRLETDDDIETGDDMETGDIVQIEEAPTPVVPDPPEDTTSNDAARKGIESPDVFVPTEDISEDIAVSFPVDI